ncbi:Phosphatidylglycerophosphatase A [Moraxella caviae]|uniref:Phosphatidylglycerophosphatase A n=1 Tax=Moraxella caviae TaxID=34060 RepID=A0A378R8P4_9GAMM|nr:phosphatidylglycerophosphatase A [Moraxella caviae]STZ10300.1 Phosphatidylglycerophosphatase A [Moraxella caviae]
MTKPENQPASQSATTHASGLEKAVYWLGLGLGSGLPRHAPGTWGSLAALALGVPMMLLGFYAYLAIVIIAALIGSYVCGTTSRLMGGHDNPHIVFDEWVGMWIALLPVALLIGEVGGWRAAVLMSGNFLWVLFALGLPFALFRLFDIIKPFPIRWVDKNVSGGFGILIDDVLAGIMAAIAWVLVAYI